MPPTSSKNLVCCLILLFAASAFAQEPAPQKPPDVRVNILNVCSPSEADQKEIHASLSRVPAARFASDFEISRGRSTLDQAPTASWVRVRREFGSGVPFVAAQYSFSLDDKSMIESLVFRSREAKDLLQVQLETTITGALDAKSVLDSDTPVNRIKLELFGKPSVVLSRCPTGDQTVYEPLFRQASQVFANYRAAMGIKRLVPRELTQLPIEHPAKKPPLATKQK